MKSLKGILLAGFIFVLCDLSLSQTATAPSGSGTSEDPYQISSLDNLYWVTQNSSSWDAYFEQTGDIDASGTSTWHGNLGLSPIGNNNNRFTGTYDGMEHTISNLTISRSSEPFIGLFGYTDGAEITTLSLTNCNITGISEVGALVGHNDNSSTITGGTSSGTVTGTSRIGGLVGENDGSTISESYSTCTVSGGTSGGLVGLNHTNASITNSYATGNVSGSSTVGGLVGENSASATISQCDASGTIIGSNQYIGGFAGTNKAIINKCYSTGQVTGASETGGFIGENYNTGADVDDCYCSGNVIRASGSSNTNIGGFIGRSYVGSSNIDNCYSTGSVTYTDALNPTDKGFCGNLDAGSINNSFWDTQTSGQSTSDGGTGKTTAEMKTVSTFTTAGWSTDTWNIDSGTNDGYPYLDWQNTGGTPLPVELTFFTATKIAEGILLEWETATEVNNYGFEIQRKINLRGQKKLDGEDLEGFIAIAFVEGHGNSSSPKEYRFVDDLSSTAENPPAIILDYRLKQIDTDGSFEYYNTIAVVDLSVITSLDEGSSNEILSTEFSLSQNYPNPFNPTTTIEYTIPDLNPPLSLGERVSEGRVRVTLKIYDILGKEITILVNEYKPPGSYQVEFNAAGLPSGIYFYKLSAGNKSLVKKLSIVK